MKISRRVEYPWFDQIKIRVHNNLSITAEGDVVCASELPAFLGVSDKEIIHHVQAPGFPRGELLQILFFHRSELKEYLRSIQI